MQSNNKRIAKNTLLLYFRMTLTMGVSLYTVRIVLNTLGVIDYGIFNVVGGVIVMFSFLSGAMASASQRFFSYELGCKNVDQLKKTFSIIMTIYTLVAVVIFLLAETLGLWLLNTQMIIPNDRMDAANWIYQFSILSFMMTVFTIPYNAVIIAHERMNIYAWMSIVEVLLKLLIVYLLTIILFDKLKVFSILTFAVTTFVTFFYRTYCIRKFKECEFEFIWEKDIFLKIIHYSGWNLFGALAGVFNTQGINIVLNIFFGPLVNTASGIAYQVNTSINQFVLNFMTATNPQITKYYAGGQSDKMIRLVFQSSKFSFILLFIIAMPILIEANFIFNIWLKEVPEYVVNFTRLIIICALIDSLSYPLQTAAQATGRIKIYQIVVGGMMIMNLPCAYLFLSIGFGPQSVFYSSIINSLACLALRLFMLSKMINLPVKKFSLEIIFPLILISISSCMIPFFLIKELNEGFIRFLFVIIFGLISSTSLAFLFGFDKNEKKFIMKIINDHLIVYIKRKN